MPYASVQQMRFMHARHPEIASRWDAEVRRAKRKGHYVKPPRRVGKAFPPVPVRPSRQWGANNSVGKAVDYPQHMRRERNTAALAGGLALPLAAGSGIVGEAERRGHDPIGFTQPRNATEPRKPKRWRVNALKKVSREHFLQAKVLGGLGAASLGLSAAYDRQLHRRPAVAKASDRTRSNVLAGAQVPLSAAALAAGGVQAGALGTQAYHGAKDARWTHTMLSAHKQDLIGGVSPFQHERYRMLRKYGARSAALKGTGALGSAVLAGTGGYGLYRSAVRSRAKKPVVKAMTREDRRALTGAGIGAAGLGVTRAGAELEHRAHLGVAGARHELERRQGFLEAARANTGPGARGEKVTLRDAKGRPLAPPGNRPFVSIEHKRANIPNLERGVAQQSSKVAAQLRLVKPRIQAARRVKAGGLGLAAGGGLYAVHAFRAANRNRAQAAGLGY